MSTPMRILVVVILLAVGIVLGYGLFQYRQGRVISTGKDRRVMFTVEKGKIDEKHQPVYVNVRRGDQVVWESDTREFEVSIEPYPDRDEGELTPGPASPFVSGQARWTTTTGRIASGPAKREAAGHQYKFHIKAGSATLDPHIKFEGGG